jgi:GT2 family glycosyltransferase
VAEALPGRTLTIVVVTWNNENEIVDCLEALGPPPAEWQVAVVDNASSDRTAALVRERCPWARLSVNQQNEGFARACNSALRASTSDFVLLLNPDTACRAEAVKAALGWLDSHDSAGLLGVRLHDETGVTQPSCFRFPRPGLNLLQLSGAYRLLPRHRRASLLLGSNWDHASARPVDWVKGAFMLAKRSAVERVGPLNEDYPLFAEDIDWCWRFWRHGLEVWFTPEISMLHHGGRSTRRLSLERRTELAAAGKYHFCASHYGRRSARLVQLTDMLGFAARVALGFLRLSPSATSDDRLWFRSSLREAARALRRALPDREPIRA